MTSDEGAVGASHAYPIVIAFTVVVAVIATVSGVTHGLGEWMTSRSVNELTAMMVLVLSLYVALGGATR